LVVMKKSKELVFPVMITDARLQSVSELLATVL